jgi:hypothetical protein
MLCARNSPLLNRRHVDGSTRSFGADRSAGIRCGSVDRMCANVETIFARAPMHQQIGPLIQDGQRFRRRRLEVPVLILSVDSLADYVRRT